MPFRSLWVLHGYEQEMGPSAAAGDADRGFCLPLSPRVRVQDGCIGLFCWWVMFGAAHIALQQAARALCATQL
jgi:hypothetical protein